MNEILLEYYQGKTKELIKCEGYIREIIKEIKRDSVLNVTRKGMTRHNEWNTKLEKELANFFNLKEVKIYWDQGIINAMTLTSNALIRPDLKTNWKNGSLSNFKLYTVMYEDLIYRANLNEQEVLAVLLHEIGHNFYVCPISIGFELFYTIATFPIGLLAQFIVKGIYKVSFALSDFIKENLPILPNIMTIFSTLYDEIMRFFKPIGYLEKLAYRLLDIVTGRANLIDIFTSYGDERGADSFAAMYGYGPDLTSGLKKLNTAEGTTYGKLIKGSGTIGSIYNDIIELSCDLMSAMSLDPHPSNNQRAAVTLKKLKKDLATGDYPREVKKDLEREIARMEKMYKVVNENSTGSSVQIRQAWYNMINEVTKDNSDFRELFKFYYDKNTF